MPPKPVAVITGSYRGIGLAAARLLGRKGFRVVVTARDAGKAKAAAEGLAGEGLAAASMALDVADPASVGAAASLLKRSHGRLDVLVNNAAVLSGEEGWEKSVLDLAPDVLRSTLETNVIGAVNVCRAFVPLMGKGGRVVNVSSGAGRMEGMGTGAPAYRISKAALNVVTIVLAAELKGRSILVNSVSPGWCRTEMGGREAPRSAEQGAEEILRAATLAEGGPTGGFFSDGRLVSW